MPVADLDTPITCPSLEQEYDAKEAESIGNKCCLCGRTPAELTEFKCEDCGVIFHRCYLCAAALRSLKNYRSYFLGRHFSHIKHECAK